MQGSPFFVVGASVKLVHAIQAVACYSIMWCMFRVGGTYRNACCWPNSSDCQPPIDLGRTRARPRGMSFQIQLRLRSRSGISVREWHAEHCTAVPYEGHGTSEATFRGTSDFSSRKAWSWTSSRAMLEQLANKSNQQGAFFFFLLPYVFTVFPNSALI